MKIVEFVKNWTLPLALFVGIAAYSVFIHLAFLTPWLLFAMLTITFCNISREELRLRPWYFWLLAVQFVGSFAVYMLLSRFDRIVAQGALICIMAPTATSAAVIANKLGGNPAGVVAYTLLANIVTAIAVPAVFPLIEAQAGFSFWGSSLSMLLKVFPILIFPFAVAWIMERVVPKVHGFLRDYQDIAFYLWALCLTIVTAQTFGSLVVDKGNATTKILLTAVSLAACCAQFFLGKTIGSAYGERIAAGQSLGQKNNVLAIWMTHTCLDPLASVGPGAYVLWQNLVNSWQLWKKRRRDQGQGLV